MRLLEIARLFLRFRFVAFGGPAAHIAMMDDEFVERRKWVTRQHFLDLVGVTNLIPSLNSTEMVMHLGYERGGLLGMIVAGAVAVFLLQINSAYLLLGGALLGWVLFRLGWSCQALTRDADSDRGAIP